jgi:hypothetical protein
MLVAGGALEKPSLGYSQGWICQILTVPPAPPDTSVLPSGLNANVMTRFIVVQRKIGQNQITFKKV